MTGLRRFEVRRPGLLVVMLGALSLSFSGQREAVTPLLGSQMAVVFAATNDLAALLALNELVTGRTRGIRVWAWVAMILAGGTALGLNTWHAIQVGVLPGPVSLVTGAEPVILAWVLSHVVALVVTHRREASGTASRVESSAAPDSAVSGESTVSPDGSVDAATAAVVPARGDASSPAQPALPDANTPASTSGDVHSDAVLPDGAEDPASTLPAQLIDRAERAERQALDASDGKRGLSYREAQRRLGVRYDTARTALNAARNRMSTETTAADKAAA